MNLQEIIKTLDLTLLTESKDFTQTNPTNGYCADLLSCVMAGADHEGIWVTLQSHANIVAVAALLDIAAVIITENAQPDMETIEKANAEGVVLLSTSKKSFEVCGLLWQSGLKG